MSQKIEQLLKPLSPYSAKNLYYSFFGAFLRTFGRLSCGINTGFTYGFDSGIIMNYIYDNKARGKFGIGPLLDRMFLDQVTCKAFRSIKQIQINMIDRYLRESVKKPTFIVDLASGKADYIYEILKSSSDHKLKVLLCDIAESSLRESRKIADELGVGDKVSFRRGDALDTKNLRQIEPKPDLLIEVGLYGIIHDDAIVRTHLLNIGKILCPKAILFNVQTQNPQIELIARALRNQHGEKCVWHLRPAEKIIGWAEEAGFRDPEIVMDPYNIYAVVMMTGK
ncbi:MAG: class I SAM-dependent methyltransferase family protein [Candidatus Dadabacteria bacterium]|nr:class I SAM-dependent methyltransferase family protein [Candidatus Dadabacteria bacterium]MCY4262526.1 class I SAM-dependent methyltransferase family protein [Candidatus Dadabacteria bacterium]